MTDHGLLLRSKPGIPTHFSNNRQGSQTTIDLQWHLPASYDWATVCKTDSSLTHSHFSDHAAILTEWNIPGQVKDVAMTRTRFNWAKADWQRFSDAVGPPLTRLSLTHLSDLPSQSSIDDSAMKIEKAIKEAQEIAVPVSKITSETRRWWDPDILNPLKGHALNLRRKDQRSNTRADKVAYRAAQAKFQKAIKDSKRHHWQRFLANLTDKDLFTAARYCDGPPASRLLPPLRQPDGTLTDDPSLQSELLFQATGGPTITCDLSDVAILPPPRPWSPNSSPKKTFFIE